MLNAIFSIPLRHVLLADAITSAACGTLLTFGAGWLAPMLGLPAGLLENAGLLLIPFAVLVAYAGLRRSVSRPLVWLIIVVNAVWVVDSIVLLAWSQPAPTLLGELFVIAQAAAVALFAELEFSGMRRAPALAA